MVVSDIFTPPPTTTSSAVKKQKKRLRHSNYLITINTNKSFIDREDPALHALTEKLRACIDKTFNNSNLGKYVTFKDKSHTWSKEWIKRCNTNTVIEIGKQKGFLHAHLTMRIAHWSCVQLDFDAIRNDMKKTLGNGMFITYKRFTSDDDKIEEYINKDVNPDVDSTSQLIDRLEIADTV